MTHYNTHIASDLAEAADWLRKGACVGIPTETVYGLAANALDPAAVVKIFEVKNRPDFDPLIVHVTGIQAIEALAKDIPERAWALMERFWPGPLTLLLPRRDIIPDLVTSGLPRVGLRAPAHPMTRALLQMLDFPLAAPSANPFGYISPTAAGHVFDQLQGKIPYILDGGPCEVGVESTIVGFEGDNLIVHRLGGLSVETLEAVAGPVQLKLNQSSNPSAPGMLLMHYAPRKPLLLGELDTLVAEHQDKKTGVLSLSGYKNLPDNATSVVLSPAGDLNEAAQRLFAAMRSLDAADIDLILAEPMPDIGLGKAMNDRLRRAAAKK